ncbi:hypothetical protein BDN72DRAFT_855447 [Pluteus cervinus]|uniref:Uncharacterized protein n=1 Tax=Pluteus cervinus TaxID=181527 RepID=A0ACD3B2A5_9AGAR|nr:hypothetical protein BDN72DRAFT_855447 [Pluteus cervinus]
MLREIDPLKKSKEKERRKQQHERNLIRLENKREGLLAQLAEAEAEASAAAVDVYDQEDVDMASEEEVGFDVDVAKRPVRKSKAKALIKKILEAHLSNIIGWLSATQKANLEARNQAAQESQEASSSNKRKRGGTKDKDSPAPKQTAAKDPILQMKGKGKNPVSISKSALAKAKGRPFRAPNLGDDSDNSDIDAQLAHTKLPLQDAMSDHPVAGSADDNMEVDASIGGNAGAEGEGSGDGDAEDEGSGAGDVTGHGTRDEGGADADVEGDAGAESDVQGSQDDDAGVQGGAQSNPEQGGSGDDDSEDDASSAGSGSSSSGAEDPDEKNESVQNLVEEEPSWYGNSTEPMNINGDDDMATSLNNNDEYPPPVFNEDPPSPSEDGFPLSVSQPARHVHTPKQTTPKSPSDNRDAVSTSVTPLSEDEEPAAELDSVPLTKAGKPTASGLKHKSEVGSWATPPIAAPPSLKSKSGAEPSRLERSPSKSKTPSPPPSTQPRRPMRLKLIEDDVSRYPIEWPPEATIVPATRSSHRITLGRQHAILHRVIKLAIVAANMKLLTEHPWPIEAQQELIRTRDCVNEAVDVVGPPAGAIADRCQPQRPIDWAFLQPIQRVILHRNTIARTQLKDFATPHVAIVFEFEKEPLNRLQAKIKLIKKNDHFTCPYDKNTYQGKIDRERPFHNQSVLATVSYAIHKNDGSNTLFKQHPELFLQVNDETGLAYNSIPPSLLAISALAVEAGIDEWKNGKPEPDSKPSPFEVGLHERRYNELLLLVQVEHATSAEAYQTFMEGIFGAVEEVHNESLKRRTTTTKKPQVKTKDNIVIKDPEVYEITDDSDIDGNLPISISDGSDDESSSENGLGVKKENREGENGGVKKERREGKNSGVKKEQHEEKQPSVVKSKKMPKNANVAVLDDDEEDKEEIERVSKKAKTNIAVKKTNIAAKKTNTADLDPNNSAPVKANNAIAPKKSSSKGTTENNTLKKANKKAAMPTKTDKKAGKTKAKSEQDREGGSKTMAPKLSAKAKGKQRKLDSVMLHEMFYTDYLEITGFYQYGHFDRSHLPTTIQTSYVKTNSHVADRGQLTAVIVISNPKNG